MVKQPFKTACLEFQVLIFFRPSYTSSHTSCKKTYTEKKYQIWCQYFRSNHEKGFLEPFQVRIAPQTWGQMIRFFQVWNVNGRRWSNRPINIWKCRSCTSSETPRKFLPPFHQLVKGVVATDWMPGNCIGWTLGSETTMFRQRKWKPSRSNQWHNIYLDSLGEAWEPC